MKRYNLLTLVVIITLLSSCSIFRKVAKTEDTTKVVTAITVDTTQKAISSNEILTSLIEKTDLSKAVITEYSKPDSLGKQSVLRTIEFNNNISIKQNTKRDITVKYDEKKGVTTANTDSTSVKTSIKTETKGKAISGLGISLLIVAGIVLLIGIFWKKRLLLFK